MPLTFYNKVLFTAGLRRFAGLMGCIFFVSGAFAQQLGLEMTVNRNPVRTGQDVQLTLTMKNFNRRAEAPEVPGLTYRYGPSTSRNSSWVNGKSSSELAYTWTYRVTGTKDIVIPAQQMKVEGQMLRSQPFKLQVVAGGNGAVKAPGSGGGGTAAQGSAGMMDDLELIIEVSKQRVVVGEPIVASFKIYNRYNGLDVRSYELPKCDGFWKEEVKQPDPNWEPKVVRGRRYNVANLRTVVLFPQKTGKLVIDGFEMEGYIRTSFFSGQNVTGKATPITIQVDPLPAPRPAGNLGAFPHLSVDMNVSTEQGTANQAFTVDLKFSGQGNLKFLREPDLNWPADFEVFDPEVKDALAINANGETGSRTFSYVVIPRAPGTFQMPGFDGQYFNVRQRSYEAISVTPRQMEVIRDASQAGESLSYNSKSDVQVLNQDIRYIITDFGRPMLRDRIDKRKGFLLTGLLLGPMIFGVAFGFRRKQEAEAGDVVGTRRKKAGSRVRKELNLAKTKLNNPTEFYEAIGTGLEDYLLAKSRMSRAAYSRATILDVLAEATPDLKSHWDQLLNDAEMARYAPGAADEPQAFWNRAKALIDETESAWKA